MTAGGARDAGARFALRQLRTTAVLARVAAGAGLAALAGAWAMSPWLGERASAAGARVVAERAILEPGMERAPDVVPDARSAFEQDRMEKAVAVLEPRFGAGHVRVRVSADFDPATLEETVEALSPAGRSAGSRKQGPGRTVRKTTSPGGRLRRLSVAVVVDARALPARGGVDGPPAADAVVGGGTDPTRIEALVAAAVGLEPERGDLLRVEMLPFEHPVVNPLSRAGRVEQAAGWTAAHGRSLASVVAILCAYWLVVRPLRREVVAALRRMEAVPVSGSAATRGPETESTGETAPGPVSVSALPAALRESVTRAGAAQPAATARFIRGWLQGDPR